MKCSKIIETLEQLTPLRYACDWDNVGLLVGSRTKEVTRILVALDATDAVVEQAISMKADLLITHHPLIFKPVRHICEEDIIGRRLLKLIKNDISYYATHTNFDVAPGCMADVAVNRLPIEVCAVLSPTTEEDGISYGIGKIGAIAEPMTLEALGKRVKEAFNLPFVTIYGDLKGATLLKQAAVAPGSGGSVIGAALKAGADVLITGDIGHHEGMDAVAAGMAVIDAGHYGLEHIFIGYMETFLRCELGGEVIIDQAAIEFPASVI